MDKDKVRYWMVNIIGSILHLGLLAIALLLGYGLIKLIGYFLKLMLE